MSLHFVAGDLFANTHRAEALAHGVNCRGSMGAGIATGFRKCYPEMFAEYRRRCRVVPRELNPGDVFLWKADNQPWVFNLATQEDYWRSRATYEAVERALEAMRTLADTEGVTSIAMPRVGAGYGGLSWKKVRAIVEGVRGRLRRLVGRLARLRRLRAGMTTHRNDDHQLEMRPAPCMMSRLGHC